MCGENVQYHAENEYLKLLNIKYHFENSKHF